jgi:ankyrin repeat protein
MVRELLEVDHANPNFRCALLSEYTPIQLASMQGNVEIAKLLVSHGADPLAKTAKIEEKDHTPYGRYSVLDLAVAMNQIGMMDYLHGLKIPLNSVSAEGQTPLMSAILVKNVEAVEKLLSLGVDIHAPEAGAVLAAAVWVNDPVLIKLMIQKGAKQEKHAIHGVPLHLAASRGSNEAIEVLLDAGANIQGVDRFKRSALHFAAYAGQTETVRLLLQRNADPNGYDSTGNSPAVAALMNDHFETAREIWKVSKNAAFDAINTSLQMGNISLGREIIRESYPNEKTYFNEVNSRKEALKFSRFTNQMEFNLLLGFPWLPQQGPMIHILQPLVQEIVQEKTAKINADRLKNKLAALQKGTISPYWNVLNDAILFATVQGKVQFVHLLLEAGASPVQAAEYLELVQFNPHVSVEQRKKFPEIKHLLQQACKRWRASVIGNHSMAQSYFGLLPIQDKSLKGVRADLRSVVFEKYKKSLINEYRFFSTVNSYANPPPEYVPLIKDPKRMESIPEVIRTQLKKGESFTRLHYAIIFQDLAAVRSLLENDLADVRRFTNTPERDTSVELAMKVKSSKEMIALLVTHSMKY